ncbi:MAG: hypothetical protein DHS20C11_35510 [Lysobacteraceae bacterium]|nr:MAG: hypothetical protein DHS20C11_35510 [Xanthomonadaceae bacterium]
MRLPMFARRPIKRFSNGPNARPPHVNTRCGNRAKSQPIPTNSQPGQVLIPSGGGGTKVDCGSFFSAFFVEDKRAIPDSE